MRTAYVAALLTVVYAARADQRAAFANDAAAIAALDSQFTDSPTWEQLAGLYHLPTTA